MYKLITSINETTLQKFNSAVLKIMENDQELIIPFDPANTDYQEFLRWCEAGNEPLPADSQE